MSLARQVDQSMVHVDSPNFEQSYTHSSKPAFPALVPSSKNIAPSTSNMKVPLEILRCILKFAGASYNRHELLQLRLANCMSISPNGSRRIANII